MTIIAQNLRRLRLMKGLTQEQAAEALHVSAQSVSRWECGSTFPDVMTLPEIARLYAVTVDDLYREQANGYENYAQRLLSVYEDSRDPRDFAPADAEFARLIASGNYTMNDLRSYGILYQYHAYYCQKQALELFDRAIAMGEETDPEMHLRTRQQKISFLCSLGRGRECVSEYRPAAESPDARLTDYILMMSACCNAKVPDEGLECCKRAAARFPGSAHIHYYSGEFYRQKEQYGEAIACWEKAIALDHDLIDAHHSIAECCEKLGQYEKAMSKWREIHSWLMEHGLEVETGYYKKRMQKLEER